MDVSIIVTCDEDVIDIERNNCVFSIGDLIV